MIVFIGGQKFDEEALRQTLLMMQGTDATVLTGTGRGFEQRVGELCDIFEIPCEIEEPREEEDYKDVTGTKHGPGKSLMQVNRFVFDPRATKVYTSGNGVRHNKVMDCYRRFPFSEKYLPTLEVVGS